MSSSEESEVEVESNDIQILEENDNVQILEENDIQILEEDENQVAVAEEQVGAENAEADDPNDASKPVKPKKVIRRPRLNLNAETLKGKRGLVALPSYFDRVKFKGRGHEEEDLSVILKTYEYWCHRLFPKYPFDECIQKIEHLGNKRAVVTQIKRIRADLIFDDDQIIPNDKDTDDEDIVVPEDQFDNLLGEVSAQSQPQPPPDLNEEQLLERIRLNKERAVQIRREKLKRQALDQSQSQCSVSGNSNTESLLGASQEFMETEVHSHNDLEENNHASQNILQEQNDVSMLAEVEPHSNLEEDIRIYSNSQEQNNVSSVIEPTHFSDESE